MDTYLKSEKFLSPAADFPLRCLLYVVPGLRAVWDSVYGLVSRISLLCRRYVLEKNARHHLLSPIG